MYNKLCLLLVSLLVILNFKMVSDHNSLHLTIELYNEIKDAKKQLLILKNENNALLSAINIIQTYPNAISEKARMDLGLIQHDEDFYQIVPTDKKYKS